MAFLRQAMAGQRRPLMAGIACAGFAALAAVGLLAVSGWFLAGATITGLSGIAAIQAFNYLLPSAAIRAAAIIRTGARYGERMLGHRASLFALAEVRTGLFRLVAASILAGNALGRSGETASRLGKDVDALEDAVIRRISRPGAWAAGGAGLIAALAMGWRAAAVYILALAAMRLAARRMVASRLPAVEARLAASYTALQADYADMAGPAPDIAVYGLAPAMTAALDQSARTCDEAQMELARAQASVQATQTIIATLALAGMVLLATASAPMLALGLLAAMAALEGWGGLAASDLRKHEVDQAAARLDRMSAGDFRQNTAPAISRNPVLCIGGANIAPGSRVLIAGASGAGKTRLVETLLGLRQDAPQALLVDGHRPQDLGLANLRPAFAHCAQDAPLVAGSVADNLALASPGLTHAAMWQALTVACAKDVVLAMPDGLQQWLGGEGARLSGGQRRRIALARALLADRAWLVLDEPSEGLDAATEARLVASLDEWLRATGTGLILTSHHPAMAALADTIVPL
jgi:ATP-binding cassette subfamily C protein CydC